MLSGAIPQIVWMAGDDGELYFVNRRWGQFTGMGRPESQCRGWMSAINGDDVGRLRAAWGRARATGEARSIDLRLRRRDGAYRWHLLQASPSRQRAGRPTRWLGTFTDIDDQKRAEGMLAFLAEAGEFLSASPDLASTLGELARFLTPRVADHCRIDLVEDDGTISRVASASHPAARDGIGSPVDAGLGRAAARVIRSGRPEWAPGIPHSASHPEHASPAPARASAGAFICLPIAVRGRTLGVLGMAMAGSGRPYGPADLALAEHLARRTALAVEYARLYHGADQARRQAELASRAKDRFLAVLSHELRTPLTPVLMAATALLDDPETPVGILPMLDMMRRNIELEARLIGDLLDVSRIGAGKLQLSRETVDAHALIWQALEQCRGDVRAAGVELEVDLAARSRHVLADPARLQQLVWNLVKNAAKFAPHGGRIAVRTSNAAGRGEPPSLLIEVEDTGIGIPPELLPRVFDPFEQGDQGAGRSRSGLGLGLAISRSVAEAHGDA